MEDVYKKTYKGLILWIVLFFLGTISFAGPIVDICGEDFAAFGTMSITLLFLVLLTYAIYKTEYIYWYNGVTYQQAAKATSEARREYAQKHMLKFVNSTLLWGVYGIVKYFMHTSVWIDTLVFCVLLIFTAVSTVRIKLEID